MKILFLDIDGVVNNAHASSSIDGWPIERFSAFLIGRIVEATGCKVVLSSSWRHSPEGCVVVEKKVVRLFDKTGDGRGLVSRGSEIKEWLIAHPEVARYAILDDNSDMLTEQMPNFFQTTWEQGLTEDIANKVIEHLNI